MVVLLDLPQKGRPLEGGVLGAQRQPCESSSGQVTLANAVSRFRVIKVITDIVTQVDFSSQ